MSRGLPLLHRRRILLSGAIGGITCAAVVVGAAMAGQDGGGGAGASAGAAPAVRCPAVAGSLPEVPAESRAEVDRNLALLDTQIAEADQRLATSRGEGGPDFVRNAVLGPLADKRNSTLDRIAISIGRHAEKPVGLDSLAECTLADGDAGTATGAGGGTGRGPGSGASPTAAASGPAGGEAGVDSGAEAGSGRTISCPDVASKIGEVPAAAQAEVDRNLALLDTQTAEADKRLATSRGEGGPDFVRNAILGPLKDKRASTIDRIELSFSRQGSAAPSGLDALAGCSLTSG
ncbi:hypothetical protein TPA0910_63380 [Streptomyces hygroscopicus subsp. sporocinereus]|uniref:Secreted protein n=1 Tax=Streptomyces hygroscopicus TaxID=1912 RepID=A0ABQ3U8H4_STRHY|nr:hypothetical protein [Streptomyces hygroscopicus]GHJ31905.1 hypothetical protein TPA0910_63380 [Streptomyces hygroscopicus]